MNDERILKYSSFRAILVGLLASFVMLAVMNLIISLDGLSPINATPVVIFMTDLGIPPWPIATILHFGYGAFWSLLLITVFKKSTNLAKALVLSLVLWLSLMLVLAPSVGWGFFGLEGNFSQVDTSALNYIEPGIGFAIITLIAHLVYGVMIGVCLPAFCVYDIKQLKNRNRFHTLREKRQFLTNQKLKQSKKMSTGHLEIR